MTGTPHFHLAYGACIGLAAAALGLLGAGLAGGTALTVRPPLRRLGAAALAIGLLVALLLPWQQAGLPTSARVSELGIADSSGVIAAVLALRVVVASWSKTGLRPFEVAGPALGTLLFAGAAWTLGLDAVHAHAAWAGLAIAALLAVVTLADRALVRTISPPRVFGAGVLIAGTALVTGLFLPWQTACYGHTSDLKTLGLAGRCVSTNGFSLIGSTVAVLTIALVVALLTRAASSGPTLELAVGLGLLVATLGFRLETGTRSGVRLGFGSGSYVGVAAGAFLVGFVLSQSTSRWRDLKAAVPSVLPIALGVAFVASVVVPWWGILPNAVWSVFVPGLAAVPWLTVASALLALRIVRLWIRQVAGASEQARELVLLSVALVVLAVLEAVPLPTVQLTWNGGVLLGLSLPLALLALIRERGGLRSLQVPELLRIDRI